MTVKSWGTGRPDYYDQAIVSRPQILEDSQIKWLFQETYTIGALEHEDITIYTVPAGYNLSFGGGQITTANSCINMLRLFYGDESLIGDFRYDMSGDMLVSTFAGQTIAEGVALTGTIWNNDTLSSEFSLFLAGILEKI